MRVGNQCVFCVTQDTHLSPDAKIPCLVQFLSTRCRHVHYIEMKAISYIQQCSGVEGGGGGGGGESISDRKTRMLFL